MHQARTCLSAWKKRCKLCSWEWPLVALSKCTPLGLFLGIGASGCDQVYLDPLIGREEGPETQSPSEHSYVRVRSCNR